ncbi:hypothetical protein [Amycolatopsis sp. NPDC004625]|uniref:hypothetical protein n=1 Tax=Amycolatopsis sp. NPDC004625 TaxID=3154670 RepID=UPI0033A13DD8
MTATRPGPIAIRRAVAINDRGTSAGWIVNGAGTVVVGFSQGADSRPHAMRWDGGDRIVELGSIAGRRRKRWWRPGGEGRGGHS